MSVSVIMCAYTLDRLDTIEAGLRAVLAQEPRPDEVIVVADHNDELCALIAERFPEVKVVPNEGPPGLSAARNTGVRHATQSILVFLDDDAKPAPVWLARLTEPFDDPRVVGAGGRIEPEWVGGAPEWFPEEFLWVVGCSYKGQRVRGRVRNPLGASMAFRADLFEELGGFHLAVGRLGTVPVGAEETEFCLRVHQARPEARMVMVDGSVVWHRVPAGRQTATYFLRRCFYEGTSKAMVRQLSGPPALGVERHYATRTLPTALVRSLTDYLRLRRPIVAAKRAAAIVAGLGAAGAGYSYALASAALGSPRAPADR
jgi:cellulose synthase/poly-beta-1,6-N-acetylglucosamine synthase-like glycosyltransferase